MLRVQVHINWWSLIDTHVVRIKGGSHPDDINTYRLPDGSTFRHRYGDGAAKLAIKMLRRIKEN